MLRKLDGLNIVGADVVEVSPPFDPSGMTALHHAARRNNVTATRALLARGKPRSAGEQNSALTYAGKKLQQLQVCHKQMAWPRSTGLRENA